MSIARDAGIISEAQQKEIDALFTGKDGKFDEEAFAEAFARELKRAFHETVQKRMEDVPTTKAGRALRRVADFIVTLAKSFAFWRQERGLDPVTGQPLQAGQVLDAFLKRERTAVDEATRLDNLARAARAASLRATAEARDNAPTQAVVDEDGTVVAYHTAGMDFGGGMFYVDYKDDISNSACLSALRLAGWNNSTIDSDPIAYSKELRRSRQNVSTVIVPFGITTTYNNGVRDYSSRGGSGFLHIVDERLANEYDELYEKDKDGALKMAIRDALRVIEAIRRGTIVEINGNDRHAERIRIEHKNDSDFETYCAILYWDRREKTFSLITGFKKDPSLAKTQVDARTGKSSVVHRRSEFQTSEYYGHLKRKLPELTRQIVAELFPDLQVENRKADPNEERRDHIHVWSGARQAYDRVDLRFIGSGTGGNNEGRGAYSSGVRGVAQDKYARGALGSLTYTADNIPVVYDGKSMTLKEAYGLARETAYRNDEIDEGWMIREINYQAGQLSSDNAIVGGLIDYNELREWMLEEFENESEPLTYEEVLADFSKLKALPIERRMGYDYGGGFDTRRYEGKDDKIIRSEMRDFYVDKDRFGFVHYRDVEEANRLYEEILAKMPKDSRKGNTRQKKLELLDKVLPELPEARPAVMEQTWFTNRPEGDVSHLLNWFEAVTPEQLGWIVEGARKAGFSEKEIAFLQRERIDDDDVLIEDGNRMPSGREMYMRLEVISVFRTKKKNAAYLRMQERLRRNPFEERPTEEETKGETFDAVTTEDLRRAHRDVMGDAGKFASEFLVSADIDGMMYPVDYRHGNRDGRVSGWNYVAFSDEHLRVDHVYEYNPETDDFELKWHEGVGSGPRFTETPLGQELVARAFDAIMGSRVDLLLRPSRYYGNPYETRERNPRKALVTEHLHRDVDVSEPKGFATEVSAEISRFGTREGDPTLRDIRARCGSKARFYEVLGAVYETAEAVRSGLAEVVTGRERAMMSNAGLQAADFIKHNATARATAAGRKLYLMGREFAWKLYQEDIASAWAEVERQRRGRGDCGMIGGKCEGKGPSRHGERRWPKARRMR